MMTADGLCHHIIHLIHAPISVYDLSGERTEVYVDNDEQQNILGCDPSLLQKLLALRKEDMPSLYLEAENVAYGVVPGANGTYLLGPCCLSGDEIATARYLVRAHGLDAKRPYRVFRVSLEIFGETLLVLFETLTGKAMDVYEFLHQQFYDEQFERSMQKKMEAVRYHQRESESLHFPYSRELLEVEAIRSGDLDALYRSTHIPYVGKAGTLSRDPLRQAKDILIVVTTLASRAAMSGGLMPELGYSMSDAFIQRAEEFQTEAEVYALAVQVQIEFCKAVHDLTHTRRQNPLVTNCKALITQRLHGKLSINELARELDVNPDYLSRLFNREEGLRLTDYISQEKIKAAKERLIYTEDPVEKIAATFGYSSQSHFGKVFREALGLTPTEFRNQYKQRQNAPENP